MGPSFLVGQLGWVQGTLCRMLQLITQKSRKSEPVYCAHNALIWDSVPSILSTSRTFRDLESVTWRFTLKASAAWLLLLLQRVRCRRRQQQTQKNIETKKSCERATRNKKPVQAAAATAAAASCIQNQYCISIHLRRKQSTIRTWLLISKPISIFGKISNFRVFVQLMH